MAGGKSTGYANNFLTWALTTATIPTRPSAWNVALYTDTTGLSVAPSTEATVSNCPGYARQSTAFGASAATGGTISNTTAATFTATGAWATVNYYGILDGSGNMIYWAPLSTSRTLQVNGDQIQFAASSITVQEK